MAAYAALLSLSQTTDLNTTQYQYLFSFPAKEDIGSINKYVNFLLLFFKEYPEKVNRWEGRIRDVAYETEDIIDVFIWRQIQSGHVPMIPSRVKLEDQLENVKQEIGLITGEVMEERPAYLSSSSSSSSSSSRIAGAANDAVIGIDDHIEAIRERLCGDPPYLQVIPIVGMGGIGKTTLARTVYDDPFTVDRFDVRAWVVVSQDYSSHGFRKALLNSMKLLGERMFGDEIDESKIALKVFQFLKKRRFLIVIDDVWETHVLDDVRCLFPDDNNGSRIMLTTRELNVAAYEGSVVHEMRFMSDSQSWDLLKRKVFVNRNCPPGLEDVGKRIAQRCAGLPLAVVLVAGFLSPMSKTRAAWEEIANNVKPVIGRELEEILSLSYSYLPHHLRPCFLFIGGFLEDASIGTSRLIRLWVAEGLLNQQNGW